MIYVDSNVFIYALIYKADLEDVEKANYYLNHVAKGEIAGCTCTLTWDEVFYIVRRSIGFEEAVQAGKHLLVFPNIEFIDVDFEILAKAQKIAEEFKVMPRDAIHAACVLEYCNGKIISSDSDFDNIKGVKRKF